HARDAVAGEREGEGAAAVVAVAGDLHADDDLLAVALDARGLDLAVDADAGDLVAAGERPAPVVDRGVLGERVEERRVVGAVRRVEHLPDGRLEVGHGGHTSRRMRRITAREVCSAAATTAAISSSRSVSAPSTSTISGSVPVP